MRRRYVVYDPEARTRHRSLFVRDLLRHARLRGGSRRRISPAAVTAENLVQHRSVAAHAETDGAEIAYDVLLWDDLVVRDLDRSRSRGVATLLATMLDAIGNGSILGFYRRNGKCASVALFPFTAAILAGLVGCALAVLVHIQLGSGIVPGIALSFVATLPLAGAAGIGGIPARLRGAIGRNPTCEIRPAKSDLRNPTWMTAGPLTRVPEAAAAQ